MSWCAVKDCNSGRKHRAKLYGNEGSDVRFFRFPKTSYYCDKWIDSCGKNRNGINTNNGKKFNTYIQYLCRYIFIPIFMMALYHNVVEPQCTVCIYFFLFKKNRIHYIIHKKNYKLKLTLLQCIIICNLPH